MNRSDEPGSTLSPSKAVLTLPNLLSLLRIALIPVFWWLIVHPSTTRGGIALFVAVVATDWVDGWIARRTGQVSELGKILDPVADRLAVGAGLIALMIRGAVPIWAGTAILARDVTVLVVGAVLLMGSGVRIEVRYLGKVATFTLMTAIPLMAWGALGYPGAASATAIGWLLFVPGLIEYYVAAGIYLRDARRG